MNEHTSNFGLPKNIEHYLAVLSKLYAQDGKRQFQEIIVNAQIRVHEGWDCDHWNGGAYGHALFLSVPEMLFLNSIKQKDDIEKKITDDLNKLHNFQNEHISVVFLEMDAVEDHEWRKDSGLLVTGKRVVPPDATKRIWGDVGFRVFLSHKSEVKKETAALKDGLQLFGISCFVAHEDIHPTKAWQDEIENALASMDGFVALMTEGFHDSNWTDQEVGYAIAKGVPIIAVRLGKDPYGFIGKFQGLSSTWQTSDLDIVNILIKNDQMLNAYIHSLHKCPSWNAGIRLSRVLPNITSLTVTQIDALVDAYNNNLELRGSFGFNGTKPNMYGPGLVQFLNQHGNRRFKYSSDWHIELVR